MKKFFIIVKREYLQVVKKKSFIVTVLLTPLFMGGIMLLPAYLASKDVVEAQKIAVIDRSGIGIGSQFEESLVEYKLDDTDTPAYAVQIIQEPSLDNDVIYNQHLDSLTNLVDEKELRYLLVINKNAHLVDSNIFLVTNAENFRTIRRFEHQLSNILSSNRLKGTDINLPVDSVIALTERIDLKIKDTKGESTPFEVKYFGALIFVMLLYSMLVGNGQILMRSIIEEKNSRIIEVLISSVTPFQLMAGKVVGMGGAALTQVAIWIIAGLSIYLWQGSLGEVNSSISRIAFNPIITLFFILFFIFGYIMYSSLFALIGSIVNNDKEAQGFMMPIVMSPLMAVFVLIGAIQDPGASWVLWMSYFPLFTPTMMLMRVVLLAPSVTTFSLFSGILGEASLGVIIVAISAIVIVWLSSKIFRIGILMYGKRPTLPEIIKWLRY